MRTTSRTWPGEGYWPTYWGDRRSEQFNVQCRSRSIRCIFFESCPFGPTKVKKEVLGGEEKLMLLRVICVVCVGILVVQFLMLIVLVK
jgi:hypothetical protein